MKKNLQLFAFLRENWIILSIVMVAAALRFWQLDTHVILFPDIGHDLIRAQRSLDSGSVPLLGIPSSVPIFKQGPVAVWLIMATIAAFGAVTLPIAILFAVIGSLAVIGLYELLTVTQSKNHGLIAAALAAASPIMVAHSRMPYHTTPIPFMTILFLAACVALWSKKKYAPFFSVLAFCGVFQFELAAAPLAAVLIYIWLKRYRRLPISAEWAQIIGAAVLGLLPQIIFDLQNNFTQLGLFFLWIGHKIKDFLVLGGSGSLDVSTALFNTWLYVGRIFSTDYLLISIPIFVLLLLGLAIAFKQFKRKQLAPIWEITLASLGALLIGFFIHTGPSEAYFPPLFVLIIIHLSCTVLSMPKNSLKIVACGVVVLMCINTVSIWQHTFFVSNSQSWTYGPSLIEHKQILTFIAENNTDQFQLKHANPSTPRFASDFDSYRWTAQEIGRPAPGDTGPVYWIAPTSTATTWVPADNRRTFDSRRIFW